MSISRPLKSTLRTFALTGFVVATLAGPMTHRSVAAEACTKWASTSGSDGNDGSATRPFRSLGKLASTLTAGQTGCLPGGQTYEAVGGNGIISTTTARAGYPITIRSGSGGRARISGWVEARPAAHDVVFTDLNFVGSPLDANGNPVAPKSTHINIDGDRVTLVGNDISNPYGVCVDVGAIDAYNKTYSGERADDFVLSDNRVHGCGMSPKVTYTDGDSGTHGVYLVNTLNARVTDNLVYNNRYRGLQTWPKAEGSLIANNLFDANATHVNIGSVLPEGYPWYSSNTIVRDNIMSNRVTGWQTTKNPSQVYGFYPAGSPDYGNTVYGNCLAGGDAAVTGNGLTARDNVVGAPKYLDRANADYRLAASSPCAGKGPARIQPAPANAGSLESPYTDNYKACYNTDPNTAELRTWLAFRAVAIGGVRFTPATRPAAGSFAFSGAADGVNLVGSDGSTAVVRAQTSSSNVVNQGFFRADSNGDFGLLIQEKSRDALRSAPIAYTVTVSRGSTVLGTVAPEYRYDATVAQAPAGCASSNSEWNGPGGRWYVDGNATRLNWEASAPTTADTTAPTLTSVEVPATTTSRTVTIRISANDNVKVTEVRFANEDGIWSAWQPHASTKSWTLSSSASAYKGVSTQVRDAAGNESSVIYRRVTCNAPCN
ncbi:MAG TPA: right-handed parallel beta-helix repeat-containing protein [Acidimicrobiales bacterium]|nr:right-handed parallel beta-helix repeat-containing protein [Acidimicrobiales bacterium]